MMQNRKILKSVLTAKNVKTVETVETVGNVETIETVETAETENLKKYDSLNTFNLKARDASASESALLVADGFPYPDSNIWSHFLVPPP